MFQCIHATLLTLVFERWSTTRPGVPTMMCGRLPSAIACSELQQ
jgi:hypothetical protein